MAAGKAGGSTSRPDEGMGGAGRASGGARPGVSGATGDKPKRLRLGKAPRVAAWPGVARHGFMEVRNGNKD